MGLITKTSKYVSCLNSSGSPMYCVNTVPDWHMLPISTVIEYCIRKVHNVQVTSCTWTYYVAQEKDAPDFLSLDL